jgi:hypothetical protein
MPHAIPVTEENKDMIFSLNNGGVVPEMSPFEQWYFVYSDNPYDPNEFVTVEDLLKTHAVRGERKYLAVDKI